MKKTYLLSVLAAVAFSFQKLEAQDAGAGLKPKIASVEEMIGHKRQFLQLIVNKPLLGKKRSGLLSLSSYAADYNNKPGNNEYQNTTLIYQPLFKGLSINSGVSFTSVEGMKNFAGLQYVCLKRDFSLIYLPSYFFIHSNKLANTALIEYKPAFNSNWGLYTRIQAHYNHNFETGHHFRSYLYSRLGLTYHYFSFGLAQNFDRYGADKKIKNNYGLFLKMLL